MNCVTMGWDKQDKSDTYNTGVKLELSGAPELRAPDRMNFLNDGVEINLIESLFIEIVVGVAKIKDETIE